VPTVHCVMLHLNSTLADILDVQHDGFLPDWMTNLIDTKGWIGLFLFIAYCLIRHRHIWSAEKQSQCGAHPLRWMKVLGVNLIILSVVQIHPRFGIDYAAYGALGMMIVQSLLRWHCRNPHETIYDSTDVEQLIPEPIDTTISDQTHSNDANNESFTSQDVYDSPDSPCNLVITVFCGQLLLFIIYWDSLIQGFETGVSYAHWFVGMAGVQMVAFVGRDSDGELGPGFNEANFKKMCQAEEIWKDDRQIPCHKILVGLRCGLSFIVNRWIREVLKITIPVLLMQEPNAMDVVKDAVAIAFICKVGQRQSCKYILRGRR